MRDKGLFERVDCIMLLKEWASKLLHPNKNINMHIEK